MGFSLAIMIYWYRCIGSEKDQPSLLKIKMGVALGCLTRPQEETLKRAGWALKFCHIGTYLA